ncbi:MAG: Mur ligase domain-containing protein, partial [Gemmobacter sp.]
MGKIAGSEVAEPVRARLADLGLVPAAGAGDRTITGIAIESRAVRPGMLFAALPGTRVHGARFAAEALASGAVAILTDAAGAEAARAARI